MLFAAKPPSFAADISVAYVTSLGCCARSQAHLSKYITTFASISSKEIEIEAVSIRKDFYHQSGIDVEEKILFSFFLSNRTAVHPTTTLYLHCLRRTDFTLSPFDRAIKWSLSVNLKVLATFGLCSSCSRKVDECSLARARKIFASARLLRFSLKSMAKLYALALNVSRNTLSRFSDVLMKLTRVTILHERHR